MKRVIIASVMLIFAVTVSLISSFFIDICISEISNSAENLYQHPDKEKINEIISDWQPIKKYLKCVTKHEAVNEIDALLSSLESADTEESISEICKEVKSLLDILKYSEAASVENVL